MKHLVYLFMFICMSSFVSCNNEEIKSLNEKIDSLTKANAVLQKELNGYRYSPEKLLADIKQGYEKKNYSSIKTNLALLQKYHPEAQELTVAKSIYEQSIKDQEIARKKAAEAAAKAEARKRAMMAPIEKIMRDYDCDEEMANDILNHRVRIGMTKMQCRASWGAPEDINRTEASYGVHEQWCYPNYRYLYFEDGRLTTIQD